MADGSAAVEEEVITMLKRHEVQVLVKAGHEQEEIRRLAGVSVRSIRRIAAERPVAEVDDVSARAATRVGRPSKVESFRKLVVEIVTQEPELRSVEVVRRARLAGYAGGKSALYPIIAAARPKKSRLTMRFEGLAGEFSQHDFGEVDVRYRDGTRERVHFFASRMKYSRWVEVTLVRDQTAETLVRTLVDHFTAIGGVPLLAVFDRPKTVALKWNRAGEVTEWNPIFAYVALELGVGVEACWPHSPRQKGSVENLVGWVKGSFFKQRTFADRDDLVAQLAEWRAEANERRPSDATDVIPAVRMAEERPRLRPVKVAPENLALRIPVYVGPTATVLHATHTYSMPPEAANLGGTLFLYRDRVRIIAGRWSAEHARLFGHGGASTLPDHRSARLAEISGNRGRRYLQRQHLLEVGEDAKDFLTELTHRRPRQWYGEVEELHDLLQDFGPAALADAFRKSNAAGTWGAEYVLHYLTEGHRGAAADRRGPGGGAGEAGRQEEPAPRRPPAIQLSLPPAPTAPRNSSKERPS